LSAVLESSYFVMMGNADCDDEDDEKVMEKLIKNGDGE
jgi:hypothetical protein